MMKISHRVFGEGRPVTCMHDDSGHNNLYLFFFLSCELSIIILISHRQVTDKCPWCAHVGRLKAVLVSPSLPAEEASRELPYPCSYPGNFSDPTWMSILILLGVKAVVSWLSCFRLQAFPWQLEWLLSAASLVAMGQQVHRCAEDCSSVERSRIWGPKDPKPCTIRNAFPWMLVEVVTLNLEVYWVLARIRSSTKRPFRYLDDPGIYTYRTYIYIHIHVYMYMTYDIYIFVYILVYRHDHTVPYIMVGFLHMDLSSRSVRLGTSVSWCCSLWLKLPWSWIAVGCWLCCCCRCSWEASKDGKMVRWWSRWIGCFSGCGAPWFPCLEQILPCRSM